MTLGCHVEDKTFTLITRDKDALCNRCHDSPQVVGDDLIVIDLSAELSELAGYTEGPIPQPIIHRRVVTTTMRMKDGETKTLRLPGSALNRELDPGTGKLKPAKNRRSEVVLQINARMRSGKAPVAKAKQPSVSSLDALR